VLQAKGGLFSGLPRARFAIREVEQHERCGNADQEDQQRDPSTVRSRVEGGLRFEAQRPRAAGDVDRSCGLEAAAGLAATLLVQQRAFAIAR
jgi:hypothetical protein